MKSGFMTALLCIFAIITLSVMPAAASDNENVPQTSDEIQAYAQEILREEILDYFSSEYLGSGDEHLSADQLKEAVISYPEYPRRITDSTGREITIVEPLERVVAYNFHAMGALDAEDTVVGVANSAMSDACVIPELGNKVNIGGGGPYEPDFEKILECEPDALLTYTELGPGAEFFEDRMPDGVPVIRLDFIRPWSLVPEMNKMGYLINHTDNSAAYEEWHDGWMEEIDKRLDEIPEDEKVRVFVDVWSTSYTDRNNERRTVSDAEHYSYYCTDADGINVASDLNSPQGTVDIEWLVQQNPDVILGVSYTGSYDSDDMSELSAQYNELMSHPALQELPAVKNNRIYVLSYRYTNGLTYPAARARVAKWFYPEYFEDIDPSAIHQEFVTDFLGSSYDVTKNGVFSYPD
ncbi:ABC transporter substrate-binding protein [Methanoplanus limicola]|uniref:ABC-type transporter, periplasmic subunit n=1 Tax=Methanoplanus limicola DSM 2279 TaxID=937775 RepID=H1Z245_9EURY|nr:ABC transporter substrate-binding protein [Methanoplanus limicola]EHQ36390.1 ABC-type transporter, periplasmic subunit [Methanoplanus limicola DSM 2279]